MTDGIVHYPSLTLLVPTILHNKTALQQRIGDGRFCNALAANAPGAFILHIDEEEDEGVVLKEIGERNLWIGQVCEETGSEFFLQTSTIPSGS